MLTYQFKLVSYFYNSTRFYMNREKGDIFFITNATLLQTLRLIDFNENCASTSVVDNLFISIFFRNRGINMFQTFDTKLRCLIS